MTIVIGVIVFNLFLLIASLWFNYCNNQTIKQRRAILNIALEFPLDADGQTTWLAIRKQYDSVSYRQHLKCLLLCGNPWKLYTRDKNEQA